MRGDSKAQPGSAEPPGHRIIGLGEGIKYYFALILGNANPGIPNGKPQNGGIARAIFRCHSQDYFSALSKLNRVSQQVDKHLTKARRVSRDRCRHVRLDIDDQLQTLLATVKSVFARVRAATSASKCWRCCSSSWSRC